MRKLTLSCIISLILVTVLLLPQPAGANSNNSILSGSVSTTISVNSPSTIIMPDLVPGTVVYSHPQTVRIISNISNWSLTVTDTSNDEKDGRLSMANGYDMENPLCIRGGDLENYRPLSSIQSLKSGGSPGAVDINNITFFQNVPQTAAPGTYSITLTFSVTPGN